MMIVINKLISKFIRSYFKGDYFLLYEFCFSLSLFKIILFSSNNYPDFSGLKYLFCLCICDLEKAWPGHLVSAALSFSRDSWKAGEVQSSEGGFTQVFDCWHWLLAGTLLGVGSVNTDTGTPRLSLWPELSHNVQAGFQGQTVWDREVTRYPFHHIRLIRSKLLRLAHSLFFNGINIFSLLFLVDMYMHKLWATGWYFDTCT